MPNIERLENPEKSLIFESSEKAEKFAEKVRENLENRNEKGESLEELTEKRVKDAIREELEKETSGQGPEGVAEGRGEWQYSAEDQANVQAYVNAAFATDVNRAVEELMREKIVSGGKVDDAATLRKLDLFHDTLTDHLYQDMRDRKMLPM